MLVIAEILGHCQRHMADAKSGAGRFVHLSKHHHHILQYASCCHLAVKFLSLAAALAYPAKNTHTLMLSGHVEDHFSEQYRLTNASPAEQTRLAAAFQRHQHIDDFDTRFENLGFGDTSRQRRRRTMNGAPLYPFRRG